VSGAVADRPFTVRTIELDLPALAGAFSRRLHDAGVPVTAERAARFARSLTLVAPQSRRRLYWTARAALISGSTQVAAFDAVFFSVFGSREDDSALRGEDLQRVAAPPDHRPVDQSHGDREPPRTGAAEALAGATSTAPPGDRDEEPEREIAVPVQPSPQEVLRTKRFDALEPDELAAMHALMTQLRIATPRRRTRRHQLERRGERIDMRRTLRASMRTGGDPIRLARRRRRVLARRMVMLLDISGSMEPYARAYLQFLSCAAGSGPNAEAFVFATQLTRLTRALSSGSPGRALERAGTTAPDWSSGTRIGDALRSFNDLHGRRGMARGAVIVILSDGWERGDPALVGREMERLARLAYRIVWVNPRAAAAGFSPQAGGMAAALPHCDALVSGHSLQALEEVVAAIGASRADAPIGWSSASDPEPEEPWASATPVAGSSVAMPSGYGPSRGRTTPGWSR
jgi:hypothetical protein